MSASINSSILRDLDVCRSLFDTLAHVLENGEGSCDLHSLAVLAEEGREKLDSVVNTIAG